LREHTIWFVPSEPLTSALKALLRVGASTIVGPAGVLVAPALAIVADFAAKMLDENVPLAAIAAGVLRGELEHIGSERTTLGTTCGRRAQRFGDEAF
jgi:hypothetical protein